LETNCNVFALRSPKIIHLITGEHGEILGRLEVGWEKVACCGTIAAISLKCVKTGKVTMEGLRKLPLLFQTVPSATSYDLVFP